MRVLVVDDSALMRRWLKDCFDTEPGIECLTARDGEDALAKLATFAPDVITLDINMPVMDGLTCLSRIMAEQPYPVVMVSSLTEKGALATFEALELGAVDYVAKPSGTVSHDIKSAFPDILAKVRAAVGAKGRAGIRQQPVRPAAVVKAPPRRLRPAQGRATPFDLMLVGASTGGPGALERVLFRLEADFPVPIIIAQHMPKRFTRVFAERLTAQGRLPVVEVTGPTELLPGAAYLAQGDADVTVSAAGHTAGRRAGPRRPVADLEPQRQPDGRKRPGRPCRPTGWLGVLLTGMGDDGAASMTRLRKAGGQTIAQSEASAVVFGMPRELIAAGGAGRVMDVDRIADALQTPGCGLNLEQPNMPFVQRPPDDPSARSGPAKGRPALTGCGRKRPPPGGARPAT